MLVTSKLFAFHLTGSVWAFYK